MSVGLSIVFIVVAILLMLVGVVGSLVPAIPGPPLSWLGLLLFFFTPQSELSVVFIIIAALVAIILVVLDYVIPSLSTKIFGGTKAGIWGCNIGLIIGLIVAGFFSFTFVGIILSLVVLVVSPFLGALVGELITKKPFLKALKASAGSFIGFLAGTFFKLVYSFITIIVLVWQLIA
ncbi:MAG: DUF456 family protein [Bacteroidales bacterium]|nr:DUF456 family protein [Bacteroidales bacterium]